MGCRFLINRLEAIRWYEMRFVCTPGILLVSCFVLLPKSKWFKAKTPHDCFQIILSSCQPPAENGNSCIATVSRHSCSSRKIWVARSPMVEENTYYIFKILYFLQMIFMLKLGHNRNILCGKCHDMDVDAPLIVPDMLDLLQS